MAYTSSGDFGSCHSYSPCCKSEQVEDGTESAILKGHDIIILEINEMTHYWLNEYASDSALVLNRSRVH